MDVQSLPLQAVPALSQPVQRFEHIEAWQQFIRRHYPWLDRVRTDAPRFSARVLSRTYGERSLASVTATRCRLARDPAAADPGRIHMIWQYHGSLRVEQERSSLLLRPGMATLLDPASAFELEWPGDTGFVVLTVPRPTLQGWPALRRHACARALEDRICAGAALAAVASLLHSPAPQEQGSARSVLNAIELMLAACLRAAGPSAPRSHAARLERLQQHVRAHLDDPTLGPAQLADAAHVSRRTLYLLFNRCNVTPGRFIRDLRLEAARDALASPQNAGRNIFQIALDHGFSNNASFSRLFKAAFGMRPSHWREFHAGPARAAIGAKRPEARTPAR
ncbi:MAG TPA: helix-turn-helix domain-containing protein [Stenotrophomonas sp.]|nr:helix-turn-helix domain-containing protein [Stenotrophomonas sp.]